ncbi:hypothetical protein E4U52_001531 [Claviceps spartinae]|nr:hypothetical protein E4U52_001531 [Claviceps spartinae]
MPSRRQPVRSDRILTLTRMYLRMANAEQHDRVITQATVHAGTFVSATTSSRPIDALPVMITYQVPLPAGLQMQ